MTIAYLDGIYCDFSHIRTDFLVYTAMFLQSFRLESEVFVTFVLLV